MKKTIALNALAALVFVACGENRHSDTVSTKPEVANNNAAAIVAPSTSKSNDAVAAAAGVCTGVDLAVTSDTKGIHFSADIPQACAGKKPVLLAKHTSAELPLFAGIVCPMLRTSADFAKYGDFNFRCPTVPFVLPAMGGKFAFDVPLMAGFRVDTLKLRIAFE